MSFRITFFTLVLITLLSACSSGNKETPECITAFDCLEGQICIEEKCVDGEAGNTGNTGDTGNSGDTGNTGNTGNSGNSGDSGNSGNSGDTGDTAADPCDPNPCKNVPMSDEICDTDGTEYSCGCITGYFWNGSVCDDTDECDNVLLNDCSEFAKCTNTTGSYECECKENYTGDGFDCAADTKEIDCENPLPDNASWSSSNAEGKLPQTWDGETWAPAADSCAWDCNENFTKSENSCLADVKTFTCSAKPGAITTVWNTVDKYTQTWNGSEWIPSDSPTVYSDESSETSCRYNCAENYTWNGSVCAANTKTYNCPAKPEPGTEWNSVDSYTQTWNGSNWLPAASSTVYNTTASLYSCRYKCAENYTWNGSLCAANTKTFTCDEKPGGITTEWNTVSSYIQTWNGTAWLPADSTTEYNAEAGNSSCRYKCRENFVWNGSVCVGDSQTFNCTAKPVTGTVWNTVSSYEQIWDGTNWIPAESITEYNITPSSEHCRFKCDNNYSWNGSICAANTKLFTCDPKPPAGTIWNTVDSYTQTWDGSKWMPVDSDTAYNETASDTACRFKCDSNYTWNGLMCVADSKPFNCTEKPGGTTTVWNTVSSYTQTWNGSAWMPAETSTTYNATASTTACRYKCANNYTWSGSVCNADTKNATCTGLPANASWNTASSITQTWNGSDWAPSSIGTHNTTSSTTECRFVCNANFNWNGSTCAAATQTFNCAAKPGSSTTAWNTVSSYTQTWNGSAWSPAESNTVYDTNPSTTSCRYKCADGYTREGENCVISTKTFTCAEKPGGTATVWNTVSSYTQNWNGSAWLPADSTTTYNETASTTECRYKCADMHLWNGSNCVLQECIDNSHCTADSNRPICDTSVNPRKCVMCFTDANCNTGIGERCDTNLKQCWSGLTCQNSIWNLPNSGSYNWDDGNQGWDTTNNYWKRTTAQKRSGTHGFGFYDSYNLYGWNLDETAWFTSSQNMSACSGCSNVNLVYYVRGQTEGGNYDYIHAACNGDGSTTRAQNQSNIQGSYSSWTSVSWNVSSSCLTSTFRLGMRFRSDGWDEFPGIVIDDMYLAPATTAPQGSFDSIDGSTGYLYGWTCDGNDYNTATLVYLVFYKNGNTANPAIQRWVRANVQREQAVGDICGGNRNHGFGYTLDAALKTSLGTGTHSVYAYAVDIAGSTGTCGGAFYSFAGMPRTFTLP